MLPGKTHTNVGRGRSHTNVGRGRAHTGVSQVVQEAADLLHRRAGCRQRHVLAGVRLHTPEPDVPWVACHRERGTMFLWTCFFAQYLGFCDKLSPSLICLGCGLGHTQCGKGSLALAMVVWPGFGMSTRRDRKADPERVNWLLYAHRWYGMNSIFMKPHVHKLVPLHPKGILAGPMHPS